ncbi:MAG: glycosyltransferase N-terminal domain-containing protein [Verrucomicrobiales bacterium]|nr:glycosyltransferase N-terminal domain-containing protein [Verrucomicrobiales bacterium]
MPRALVYLIYNLLLPLVLLLGLPSFLIKGIRRGGLARNFKQRLGFFSASTLEKWKDARPIWIHAVSVGEAFIAFKVIEELQALSPSQPIVLSTTTTTGFALAVKKESPTLTVIHNPVDIPFITARVIRKINPLKLVLVEAEIWPNLVRQLRRKAVPVLLINARLSPRSEKRYLKFQKVIQPVFSLVNGATVPYPADVPRWAALGIPENNLTVTGSIKFDDLDVSGTNEAQKSELEKWLAEKAFPENARVLLAGSTHPGEEKYIAEIAKELVSHVPQVALIIVPRHAERGEEIAGELEASGFYPVLKSSTKPHLTKAPPGAGDAMPVWIANTTGELRSWYQLAEIVVVGKSFLSRGGQNPVEPVLAGKATVVGPNMENFTDVINDLLAIKGIQQVHGADELQSVLAELFSDAETGKAMADRGIEAMERHRGATGKNATFILEFEESATGQDRANPSR